MSESVGFSEAEKAAMAERAEELRAQRGGKKKAEALQDLLDKIEAMPEQDRAIAVALHQIVDDGDMWPTSFAVTALTDDVRARIADLVRRAVG